MGAPHQITPEDPSRNPDHWFAIVVGIDHFQFFPDQNLKAAVRDAKAFETCLVEDLGFSPQKIDRLINEQATRQGLAQALSRMHLLSSGVSGGRIVVYVASHGTGYRDDGQMVNGGFLLHDSTEHTDMKFSELFARVDQLEPLFKLIILDCCFAGTANLLDSQRRAKSFGKGVTRVICACSSAESAHEASGEGFFTTALIQEVKTAASHSEDIYAMHLCSQIGKNLRRRHRAMQDPQWVPYFGEGDFYFQDPRIALGRRIEIRRHDGERRWREGDLEGARRSFVQAFELSSNPAFKNTIDCLDSLISRQRSQTEALEKVLYELQQGENNATAHRWDEAWIHLDHARMKRIGLLDIPPDVERRIEALGTAVTNGRRRHEEIQCEEGRYRNAEFGQDNGAAAESAERLASLYDGLPDRVQYWSNRCKHLRGLQVQTWHADLLRFVRNGNFDSVESLCRKARGVAPDYPELKFAIERVPQWRDQWNRLILPSTQAMDRGEYAAALGHLEPAIGEYPGVEEWIAACRRQLDIRSHWDGLEYIRLPSGLWMSRTPVTVAAYNRLSGRVIVLGYQTNPREPRVAVRYSAAESYCHHAGGRLPTPAEWELAAISVESWAYPWGNEINSKLACYSQNKVTEVGKYPPSPRGFLDLTGLVWEWCDGFLRRQPGRTVRGGSFRSRAEELVLNHIQGRDPSRDYDDVGFRCLLHGAPSLEGP